MLELDTNSKEVPEIQDEGEISHCDKLHKSVISSLKHYIDRHIPGCSTESEHDKEVELVLRCFLEGNVCSDELGGLVALRGFVYQYYVILYYMMEMALDQSIWEKAIFELGDDITLLGKGTIRFIQVKTEKEDNAPHCLTQRVLIKRDKGINSWLDKLFMNLNKFCKKQEQVGVLLDIKSVFEIQFELSTNMDYDSKGVLAPYGDNDIKKHKEDKLEEKLNEAVKTKENETIKFVEFCLEGAKWYLDRFSIKHFGKMDLLLQKIQTTVSRIIKDDDAEISRRILQKILMKVIERTHKDNLDKSVKEDLVFNKIEIRLWIEIFEKEARNEIDKKREAKLIQGYFKECFEQILAEIETDWNYPIKNMLVETVIWIQCFLTSSKDPFMHERFINRLFLLDNSKAAIIDLSKSRDKDALRISLKSIILYMALYSDREILFNENTKFLLKQGYNGDDFQHIFTLVNRRNTDTITTCVNLIHDKAKECPTFQTITDDVWCFLIDVKEDRVLEANRFLNQRKISTTSDQAKITDKFSNIRFCSGAKIGEFFDELCYAQKIPGFECKQIKEHWKNDLAKQNREWVASNGH